MGLIFLEISNRSKFSNNPKIIENKANRNHSDVMKSYNDIINKGNNEYMLTNIEDMKNKVQKLVNNGSINVDDISYTQLNGQLIQAINIQSKPNKGMNDILDFYVTWDNFNDIYSVVGEKNV